MFGLIRRLLLIVVLSGGLGLRAYAAPPPPDGRAADAALLSRLHSAAAGRERIVRSEATGRVRLLSLDPQRPLPRPDAIAANARPELAARAFLADYGALFGVPQPDSDLATLREQTQGQRSFVRFQQVHKGVPLLGGELIVQMDGWRNLLSVSGKIQPDLQLRVAPTISGGLALERARAALAKQYDLRAADLQASTAQLWLYDPALLGWGGPQRTTLVWRTELSAPADSPQPIRELVLVDAQSGAIALHFNQIAADRRREVCSANNVPDSDQNPDNDCLEAQRVRSEGAAPSGDADVDSAYDFAGDTYDFFAQNFGRDSLDDQGMSLVSLVKYCPTAFACPYANAFWDGKQMTYGDGFAQADDVVGHELAHGFTEFTSGLFYYYQSGAINESMSDVFGELIDLTNQHGDDSAGVRWLIGEDLPSGALRSMQDPTMFGNPDRTGSALYWTSASDNGGVHSNSGVNNKAAALLADGGSFNSYTVGGLGVAKVGWIYYITNAYLLTSGSDYQDLGDALQVACASLIGCHAIVSDDCEQVRRAVLATEMDQPPARLNMAEAPICAAGQNPIDLFYDDMESLPSSNWAPRVYQGANGWVYHESSYATSGSSELWGYDWPMKADYTIEMSYSVALPAGAFLHFRHAYDLEYSSRAYDGGVLEYSVDAGASWQDAGDLFSENGYNVTLNSSSNPLNGRRAFGGTSRGYYSSRVDLSSLAGQQVRFRFRLGTDSLINTLGWFIDDVRIYTCTSVNTAPKLRIDHDLLLFPNAAPSTTAIGAVSDAEDSASDLIVSAANVPPGLTLAITNTAGVLLASASGGCDIATGSYTITLMVADSGKLTASADLRIDVLAARQLLRDSSFEAGTPNPYWSEQSNVYGTPLCDAASCGTGSGSAGPYSGGWWAWMGGAIEANDSILAQQVTLPAGSAQLEFYLWIGAHNGTGSDSYLRVLIDSTELFRVTDASTAYDSGYQRVALDVSAFAGGTHTLRFVQHNPAALVSFNVNVDDVTLTSSDAPCVQLPAVSFTTAAQSFSEGAGHISLQLQLSGAAAQTVTVPLTFSGTAVYGSDYTAASQQATISAGAQQATVELQILEDALDESDETIVVQIGTPTNAQSGAVLSQTISIRDNDPAPSLGLGQSALVVGERAGSFQLPVTLSAPSALSATLQYSTSDGTARAGSDYTAQSGTLVFPPGSTTQTISVPITADTQSEADETFSISFADPHNATLDVTSSVLVTIQGGYQVYLPMLCVAQ